MVLMTAAIQCDSPSARPTWIAALVISEGLLCDTTREAVAMSGNVSSGPPAEPALKVDTREELVYLLGQACEIEHGLMCEYLYAQFSLKRGTDEGLTPDQLARVQAWEAALDALLSVNGSWPAPPHVMVCRCSARSRSFIRWGAPP